MIRSTVLRRYSRFALVWLTGPLVPIAVSIAGLVVARSLTPQLYGHVAYFFSSFNLITILLQLGLGAQTTREVAWSVTRGGVPAASKTIPPYLIARILSVAFLVPLAIGAALVGDIALAAAAVAGGIALLRDFAQALLQGLGRASFVAGIQISQGLLYLLIIVAWAKQDPVRVYGVVIATYALVLLIAVWASRQVLPGPESWWSSSRGQWRGVGQSLGWLYAIALLQAPVSSLAVMALGRAERFEDAAAFSIALTIPFLLAVSAATVIAIQYYPRLCHLLADASSDIRPHTDLFYRTVAWMCVSAAAMLFLYSRDLISVLFTATYQGAAEPLVSLAPAAAVLPIGQFAMWTLIAYGLRRWAFFGAGAQLMTLLPFIAATLLVPGVPLWVLGAGHTLAAIAGLAVWIVGLRQRHVPHNWHSSRVVLGSAIALGTAVALRFANIETGWAGLASLALIGLVVAAASALILWSTELGSSFAPLRHALAQRMNR